MDVQPRRGGRPSGIRVREAPPEAPPHRPIARAQLVRDHGAEHGAQVFRLGQLGRAPDAQQRGAGQDIRAQRAARARVRGRVEGTGVQPEPVDGAA